MRLNEVGEFGFIKRIATHGKCDSSVKKGIGDDCAVIAYKRGSYLLFTCDMLLEGVDFRSNDDPYLIGRKALACSISDIAACGGSPRYALVSLGIPSRMRLSEAEGLYRGIYKLAEGYGINIVGGDTSGSRSLVIDISMLGEVKKEHLVLRNGARAGDIIFVSGALGGTIHGKHLTFEPRLRESRYLVRNFKVNAMIDISDGLIQDLGHILCQSKKGAFLFEQLIPRSPCSASLKDALCAGEDFELLFTMSHSWARRLCRQARFPFYPIGEIVPPAYGLRLLDKNARLIDIRGFKGYRHF